MGKYCFHMHMHFGLLYIVIFHCFVLQRNVSKLREKGICVDCCDSYLARLVLNKKKNQAFVITSALCDKGPSKVVLFSHFKNRPCFLHSIMNLLFSDLKQCGWMQEQDMCAFAYTQYKGGWKCMCFILVTNALTSCPWKYWKILSVWQISCC